MEQANANNLSYPSRIQDNQMEVYQDGEWKSITIKGVNMGMAKPGTFPGEAGIQLEEYERWLKQIGEMNANAIRIYTLHPPEFYKALAEYNKKAEEPIYLLHGVWIDEEPLEEKRDAFDTDITQTFQQEMKKIVDVIHGEANIPEERGHASGTYKHDVSPYVIGWVIGIEWYPYLVDKMDKDYPNIEEYEGDYTYTENANPMEHWMAQQLDVLMSYEVDMYNSMRPLSFTNWVSTDNLEQPAEPLEQEDLATIDPNHIKTRNDAEFIGMFASYHVYPYYPDFLNLEEKYIEFKDHRGEKNNYAGYLHDLNESHDMPILIAEFGIPASRGLTHRNPFGWNQGFISETEQGDIVKRLYEDILQEEMLGGLIFTWQDEWFKRTWNTMDYDNPDRRPFWSNAQTNEQQFGLLSFDRHKVKLNGKDDWEEGETLFEKNEGLLRKVMMDHDERYLYLKTHFSKLDEPFWHKHDYEVYFSLRSGKGIPIPSSPKHAADYRLTLSDHQQAKIEVAGDYDPFFYSYAKNGIEATKAEVENKAETYHPIRLALNKEIMRPDTKEIIPFESYETGKLRFGIGDPSYRNYDSLADYYYSKETNILEIRIPWMLLNARDPSQKEFIGDLWEDGIEASMTIDGIDVHPLLVQNGRVIDEFSNSTPSSYNWEPWDLPKHRERLKQSYEVIQELFSQSN
ncbi:hypothetical protein GCM10010954_27230 [Halobacillus andaensis]|uniref:Family 2 glycosyl transferase n=1 Tax=Halobacillus andaensis TaxID=1176239 RepID=A0A917B8M8_HALAA|nr:hypothetical protein GCM10010954_27230 [Halobacillus andaensis]